MAEIKCPKCGEVFQVSESQYEKLLEEVRSASFEREIHDKLLAQREITAKEVELAKIKAKEEASDEIAKLKDELAKYRVSSESNKAQYEKDLRELKERNERSLKEKDEQIAFYRDLKAKLSTKMLGETLEQHCEVEFNRVRPLAFPNAYFEKDNDIVGGTKGDYVFREMLESGAELVSIMFEMKNEADESASKKTNESHFKKLDEDRQKKGCEYAVLVSTLEPESELYNAGITDVSYKYPKMYVIRPQCFIPFITLVRSAALKAAELNIYSWTSPPCSSRPGTGFPITMSP